MNEDMNEETRRQWDFGDGFSSDVVNGFSRHQYSVYKFTSYKSYEHVYNLFTIVFKSNYSLKGML